jgi:hypothetical protein
MQLLEDLLILSESETALVVRKVVSGVVTTIVDSRASISVTGDTTTTLHDCRVEILLGGGVGAATFRWSDTDGANWNESDIVTGSSIPLANSGLTLHFSTISGGVFTTGDSAAWASLSQDVSLADASLVIDTLHRSIKVQFISNIGAGGILLASDPNTVTDIQLLPTGNLVLGTFTGLLKGTSGVVSAATPGSDYVATESDPVAMGYIDQNVKTTSTPSFTGLILGVDAATNIAGSMKLWSAGANNNYATFTAGVMSEVSAYTLPTAKPASAGFLKSSSTGAMSWDTATYVTGTPWTGMGYLTSVTAHNVLSATHGDALADTVVRGDILYGNATPKWARLAFPATPTGKILQATATDVAWSSNPLTIGASASVSGSNTGDQTLSSLGAQASSAILTALAGLTWASGSPLVKMTGASAFGLDATVYLTAEADTLATVTGRGALTTTAVQFQNALAAEFGKTAATMVAGAVKFWSAGVSASNNFSSKFTAGTQTADASYTLPTGLPASTGFLKSSSGGVMSWDTATYIPTTSLGTSGTKIPYLDGNNTFSGNNGFTKKTTFSTIASEPTPAEFTSGLNGECYVKLASLDGYTAYFGLRSNTIGFLQTPTSGTFRIEKSGGTLTDMAAAIATLSGVLVGYSSGCPTNGALIAGTVGIGVSSPQAKLNIIGANTEATADFMITYDNTGNYRSGMSAQFYGGNTANNKLHFRVCDATSTGHITVMTLLGSGRVGIGITAPAYLLDVNGDVNIPAGSTYRVGATAGITATVTYVDTLLGAKTLTFTKGILTAQA